MVLAPAMMRGYSDRINHAFAFAAKHHDHQVRKGVRLPYFTHPANMAVILTRYDRDENTVLAGILLDVMADCVRDGYTAEMLDRRIGEKFGRNVLTTALAVTERRFDDGGVEMSLDERKTDVLDRLRDADDSARWVCAADAVHRSGSLLAELRRTDFPESVWERFGAARSTTIQWYRRVHDRLREVGFNAPIVDELRDVAEELGRIEEPAKTR